MIDKWGRRFFKAGGVWLLVTGLVHGISLFGKPVPANDTERQLLDLMTNYHFNLMGSIRTMDNVLKGFSVTFTLAMLGFGVSALALSRERAGLLKRMALVNTIWLIGMTGVSLHYFFATATAVIAAGLLLFAAAWVKLPGR